LHDITSVGGNVFLSRVQREMSRQAVTEGFALRAHYTPLRQPLADTSPIRRGSRTTDGRPYKRHVSAVHLRICPFGRIIRSYTKESDVMGSAVRAALFALCRRLSATESDRPAARVLRYERSECWGFRARSRASFRTFLSRKEKYIRVLCGKSNLIFGRFPRAQSPSQ